MAALTVVLVSPWSRISAMTTSSLAPASSPCPSAAFCADATVRVEDFRPAPQLHHGAGRSALCSAASGCLILKSKGWRR